MVQWTEGMSDRIILNDYLSSFGYTQEDIDWMVEHEDFHLAGPGGCDFWSWADAWEDPEFRAEVERRMRENNPMFNKETALKVAKTKKENGTCAFSYDNPQKKAKNKKKTSERMKGDNPVHKNPIIANNRNMHKECSICGKWTNPGNLVRWHGEGKCNGQSRNTTSSS